MTKRFEEMQKLKKYVADLDLDRALEVTSSGTDFSEQSEVLYFSFFNSLGIRSFYSDPPTKTSTTSQALSVLKLLAERVASPVFEWTMVNSHLSPIYTAAYFQWPEGVKFLLEQGASLDSSTADFSLADYCIEGYDFHYFQARKHRDITSLDYCISILPDHIQTLKLIGSAGGKLRHHERADTEHWHSIESYIQASPSWLKQLENRLKI